MFNLGRPSPSADRQRLLVGFCCLSVLVVSVDGTIVNVGLPSIQHALHAQVSGLQWVTDAYTLVIASLLMLTGSLADRFGRRRVFVTGMSVFVIGSLLCSVAPSLDTLILARVIQAGGGACLNPVALAIIANAIPDRRARAAATGVWAAVAGIGIALGPICGGALIAAAGWRAIFWFNAPVGLIAILGVRLVAPESRAEQPRRLDLAGQVLMIGMIGGLTGAIIEGAHAGWGSSVAMILDGVTLASAAGFLLAEHRSTEPMLELRFFQSAPFTGATVIALASFVAMGGLLFLNTLYLQDARGYSPLHAGLLTLPFAVSMACLAPVSGRIVGSHGARIPFLIAGVCGTLAPLALITLKVDESLPLLLGAYVVFGISMGMVNSPIAVTAVSGMPADRVGVAAAVASTGRQLGNALGVAIAGAFVVESGATQITDSTHLAWVVLAGAELVVLITGLISTSRWARASALSFDADSDARPGVQVDSDTPADPDPDPALATRTPQESSHPRPTVRA